MKIQAEEIIKTRSMINELLSHHTGKDVEQIKEETERDRYMSAEEAKEYGLIDEVLAEEDVKSKNGKDK